MADNSWTVARQNRQYGNHGNHSQFPQQSFYFATSKALKKYFRGQFYNYLTAFKEKFQRLCATPSKFYPVQESIQDRVAWAHCLQTTSGLTPQGIKGGLWKIDQPWFTLINFFYKEWKPLRSYSVKKGFGCIFRSRYLPKHSNSPCVSDGMIRQIFVNTIVDRIEVCTAAQQKNDSFRVGKHASIT